MTLYQAEDQAVDLSRFTPAHVAAAHPVALGRMTKIITPRKGDDPDSELLVGVPAPLVLWPSQVELVQMMMMRRRIIVLKARQLGISWAMALYALWYVIAHENAQVVIVSIGEREARTMMRRIKFLYDNLPASVKGAFPQAAGTLESFSIGHRAGESLITSLPSSSTAGRGETTNVLILDEGAHWEDADARMTSLLPSTEDLGQVVLASTANGVGGVFHGYWQAAQARAFQRKFFGALERPDRDDAWVEDARDRLGPTGPQEYPLTATEAFLTSGRCAFDTRALAHYDEFLVEPYRARGNIVRLGRHVSMEPDLDHGAWKVWSWRQPDRDYLITADVCAGPGAVDFSCAAVYDMHSWDQVAAYRAQPDPIDFATILIRAGWLWKASDDTPALLAPEANEQGRGVIAILRERSYQRIWSMATFDQDRTDRVEQKGWLSTARSRPTALASLKEGVREQWLGIRDKEAIGEMFTFEFNPQRNKEMAREGEHDDLVMTHAIAAAVLLREASGTRPRSIRPVDLQPYRRPASPRTGY